MSTVTIDTDKPPASMLDRIAALAEARAQARVAKLRARHPRATRRELAELLVASFSRRAGWGGAATGAMALASFGLGLPAGVAVALGLQAELVASLLALYGLEASGEAGRLKLFALWAGSGLSDAAKSVGLRTGAEALGHVLAGSLPARLGEKLHPLLVRAILKRVGLGWLPRALELWPLAGAPLGYLVDSRMARALGRASVEALEASAKVSGAVTRRAVLEAGR